MMKRFSLSPTFLVCILLLLTVAMLSVMVVRGKRQVKLNRELFAAIIANDVPSVVLLLHQGADANAHDSAREQAASWERVRQLLCPNCSGESAGDTMLFVAMGSYDDGLHVDAVADIRIFQALLKAGADVNARDAQGGTPLIESVVVNRPDLAHLFLKWGADKQLKDTEGDTAYSLEKGSNSVKDASHPKFLAVLKPDANTK